VTRRCAGGVRRAALPARARDSSFGLDCPDAGQRLMVAFADRSRRFCLLAALEAWRSASRKRRAGAGYCGSFLLVLRPS